MVGRIKNQVSRQRLSRADQNYSTSIEFSYISNENEEDGLSDFDSLTFADTHSGNQEQTYFRGGSFSTSMGSKYVRHGRIHKSKALRRQFDIQTTIYSASTSSSTFSALPKRRKFGRCHQRWDGFALCTKAYSNMALVRKEHFVRDIGILAKSISPIYALVDGKVRFLNGQNLMDVVDNLTTSSSRKIRQFSITQNEIEPAAVSLGNHSAQFTTSKAMLNAVDDLSHFLSTATNFSSTTFTSPPTFSLFTLNDRSSCLNDSIATPLSTVPESTTTTVSDVDDDGDSATTSATVRPFERAFASLTVADAKFTVTEARNSSVSNLSRLSSMLNNFQDLSIDDSQMTEHNTASVFDDTTQYNLARQEDLCKRFSTLPISERNLSTTIPQRTP